MSTCTKCHQSIFNSAQFCQNCGASQSDSDCNNCGYLNPGGWVRCENCGLSPGMTSESTNEFDKNFVIDFREIPAIQPQIEKHFSEFLNQKTKEEFGRELMSDYITIFKKTDYPHDVKIMAAQLAEQVYTIHCRQDQFVQRDIDFLLVQTFASVVDEFFLSYCYNDAPITGTNSATTPSTTTTTSSSSKEIDAANLPLPTRDREVDVATDRGQSTNQHPVTKEVHTYFDVENNPYKIYADLNKMPARILDEVKKNFLFNSPKENVLLIYDDTVFGSGRTGFALTTFGIYWKTHFQNAHRTYYHEIMNLEMDGRKLIINDTLFDIDDDVNFKVYEWLRKNYE